MERAISQYYGESPTGIAQQMGIDPRVFLGLIKVESDGSQNAVSSAGARGLTQLMPATAAELGVDPDDPFENLYGGAQYLRQQYDRFGNWWDALRAYNAGPTGASSSPSAGAGYARKIFESLGMAIPENAATGPQLGTTQGKAEQPEPETLAGKWTRDFIGTLKGYGIQAVLWLVVGLLVIFGVYALATGKATAVAAA